MPDITHTATPKNLWSLLQPALRKYHRNPVWICRTSDGRRVVTYRQLEEAALTTADKLRQLGIADDNAATVGITAPNGPEFAVAALAAWKIGANIAPIHIGNSDYEIAAQMDALSPQILLTHESTIAHPLAMEISMQVDTEAIRRETNGSADFAEHEEGDDEQLAARFYTSGSTGHPKVVRLSHGNLISNVRAADRIESFTERDRFIALLPFSHAMGLMGNLLLPLCHGSAIVTPRVLAAAEILDTLQQENISVMIAVPRLYRNILLGLEKKFQEGGKLINAYRALIKWSPMWLRRRINAPLRKKLGGQIKAWVSGGSHLDGRISRYYHDLGLPLRQGYGLTETSPLTSIQENFDTAVDSVGKPVEKVRVKIYNPDQHGSGEIWIAGPNVMLGYDDPEQTAESLQDGWFKSGDIGHVDAHGRIFLTGRSKRVIVTEAGKNIYPEELETLLERDPAVKEAGVLEVDGKPVCVLSVVAEDATKDAPKDAPETAGEILAAFNQLVSSHNHITRFALVDELPRTALGKMALQELPAIFARHEVK